MQCRNALTEAEGDMEKAIAILKKNSSNIAAKKADREAKDGAVMIKAEGGKAFLVSLHCETDFVSKNEDFTNLLKALTDKAFAEGIEAMKAAAKDMIDPIIQKTGENIQLGEAFEVDGATLGTYVHGGKAAVIVSLEGGSPEVAKDVAMHVAAMKPEYMDPSEISAEQRQLINEVFEKEVASIDKPENIKKKMLEGKISTYFKEKTLLDQPFIKNPDETIAELLDKNKAKIKEVKRYSI